jgi:uncharacterized protein
MRSACWTSGWRRSARTHCRSQAALHAGLETVSLLEPGEIYALEIEVSDIALELAPGESLEIAVSSSLAPNYHPNSNTGLGYAGDAPPVVVRQTIYHGGRYPSRLVVWVAAAGLGRGAA